MAEADPAEILMARLGIFLAEAEDDELDNPMDETVAAMSLSLAEITKVHRQRESTFYRDLLALDDHTFFQHLRLSTAAFNHLLSLINLPDQPGKGKQRISAVECLMLTLWFLVNKTSFRETAVQFSLSISTVHRIFYITVHKICELCNVIIKWPQDLIATEQNFREMSGFPGIIGAIDATHIKVRPPQDHQKDYLDRTMQHSEVLLAVCDENMKFTHISTGFPGSIHDQRCLDLSHELSAAVKTPRNTYFPSYDYHLAGDSGFKLESTLLVPFKDYGNLTGQQKLYNTKLSKARVIIENSFAFLKGRFRCLKHLEVDIHNVTQIIVACCILHNVALSFPDSLSLGEVLEASNEIVASDDDIDLHEHSQQTAEHKRNRVCNSL